MLKYSRILIAGAAAAALAACSSDGGNPMAGWFGIPKDKGQQTAAADGGSATTQQQSAQQGVPATAASPKLVRRVQEQLKAKGIQVGQADGVWGEETQQAVMQFQQKENLRATGQLDAQTLAALGISGEEATADGGDKGTADGGGATK